VATNLMIFRQQTEIWSFCSHENRQICCYQMSDYSNSSLIAKKLIVRESHKESLLVTSSSSLIGLLLYYDAVLPVSLKRPVMTAV